MACHSQRGLPLFPTKDHISSTSASPACSMSQAISAGFSVCSRAVFTDSSTASFFLSSRSTVLKQIGTDRAVSRTPLALRRMSMIVYLTSGKHPRLQESSRKLLLAQRVFWHKERYVPRGRFAAFDDLVTLTVRTVDRDASHGPFLPEGGYEDEAQCDSNRSLSPLLKYYRPLYGGHQGRPV